MTADQDPAFEKGEPFDIAWRVTSIGNPAVQPYYHIPVEVFLHQFEDADYWVVLVTQDWLDDHPDEPGTAAESAGYARFHVDGVRVDPENPFGHLRIDRPEAAAD